MLIEILSLLFHIYFWMTWLRGDNPLPGSDGLKDLLDQVTVTE